MFVKKHLSGYMLQNLTIKRNSYSLCIPKLKSWNQVYIIESY